MKDEKWFEDLFGEILDKYYSCDPEKPCPDAIKIIKEIYTQGRADQNEADLKAARITEYYLEQPAETVRVNMLAAILAAGPVVWE